MSEFSYSRLLLADAQKSGQALFQRADALGENGLSSLIVDPRFDSVLRYDAFVVSRLISRTGAVDADTQRFVKFRPLVQSALSVLRDKGLETYLRSYHDKCIAVLLKCPEIQQSATGDPTPPLLVRLRAGKAEEDIGDALETLKCRITARLAWRVEALRKEPEYMHWLFTAGKTLSLCPEVHWPVPDSVVCLMVQEARAIVAENLIVGGRYPQKSQLLRYSIWHGYCGEVLMLVALKTALEEWTVELNKYNYIERAVRA